MDSNYIDSISRNNHQKKTKINICIKKVSFRLSKSRNKIFLLIVHFTRTLFKS